MQKIIQHLPSYKNFQIDVLRLDLIHPLYGGNKCFKLKYNVLNAMNRHAERSRSTTAPLVLTFGGAHSNHIYSTAAFCHENNIRSIAVIRGEESMIEKSPTLQFAQDQGMHLHFMSREKYRNKTDADFINELRELFGDFYLIPEGGNNEEGIKGCMEILDDVPFYDYVFCASGTACTYTGILASSKPEQIVVGISILKGENKLIEDVNENAEKFKYTKIAPHYTGAIHSSTILNNYHFGGYAKYHEDLIAYKKEFEKQSNILLDYVYTAKLFYAVHDLIAKNLIIPDKKILIIHSGGQQGNKGYEERYKIIV